MSEQINKVIDKALETLCKDVSDMVKNYLKIDLICYIQCRGSYSTQAIFYERTTRDIGPYIIKKDIALKHIMIEDEDQFDFDVDIIDECRNVLDTKLDIINNLFIIQNIEDGGYEDGLKLLKGKDLSNVKKYMCLVVAVMVIVAGLLKIIFHLLEKLKINYIYFAIIMNVI